VLADADLVGVILAGNVGPSSFAAVSCVCRTWATVCKTDERVVRGAALYTGGLTKSALMNLFAISSQEADGLPRSTHKLWGRDVLPLPDQCNRHSPRPQRDGGVANKAAPSWYNDVHVVVANAARLHPARLPAGRAGL
jgi:hypothetical protein